MKIDKILTELVIFARERGGDDEIESILKAAERHLEALRLVRARRARLDRRRPECERCGGPSSSGILCWACLSTAPFAIRDAFRNAIGMEGMRRAAEQIRTWIRSTDDVAREQRRSAA